MSINLNNMNGGGGGLMQQVTPQNNLQQQQTIMEQINTLINLHMSSKTIEIISKTNTMIINILVFITTILIVFYGSDIKTNYPLIAHDLTQEPLYRLITFVVIILISRISVPLALLLTIFYLLVMLDVNLLNKTNETFMTLK